MSRVAPSQLFCKSDLRTIDENRRLARKSEEEVNDPQFIRDNPERALKCPACNRVSATVFADIGFGHMTVKCKCGVITVYNLGVFYSEKQDDTNIFKI